MPVVSIFVDVVVHVVLDVVADATAGLLSFLLVTCVTLSTCSNLVDFVLDGPGQAEGFVITLHFKRWSVKFDENLHNRVSGVYIIPMYIDLIDHGEKGGAGEGVVAPGWFAGAVVGKTGGLCGVPPTTNARWLLSQSNLR